MIATVAWRASIGRHNNCRRSSINKLNKGINIGNAAKCFGMSLVCSAISVQLISILLMIGCIEANPGPFQDFEKGNQ